MANEAKTIGNRRYNAKIRLNDRGAHSQGCPCSQRRYPQIHLRPPSLKKHFHFTGFSIKIKLPCGGNGFPRPDTIIKAEHQRLMWKVMPVLGFLVAACIAQTATPRDDLVVTSSWLQPRANDKDLVILHAGSARSFADGHIAGARPADLEQVSVSGPQGLLTELPTAEELRRKLEALGISDKSRVLVYSDTDNITRATRILLTLDAAGFGRRSYLLDGGLQGWKAEGRAVVTGSAKPAPGQLSPLEYNPPIVDADFVKDRLPAPGYLLIDGRDAEFYNGETESMGGKGHIPGARNVPFTAITDASGKMKSQEELQRLFTAAGYKPGDQVIAYCHIGIHATTVIFAARTLGIDAKLYDGSFQDWVMRGFPVELP